MKKISEHLGQIIVALAAIALLVTAVVVFRAPLGQFFDNIVSKETSIVTSVLGNMGDFDLNDDFKGPKITLNQELGSSNDNPLGVESSSFTLSGTVTDESGVASLTVNGTNVTVANDGTWSTTLSLTKNVATEVTVVATDSEGNTTEKTGYVGYIQYTAFTVTKSNRGYIGYDASAESQDLVIPATFEKYGTLYKVVSIDNEAFWSCKNLTSVSIPASVTNIGKNPFSACSSLSSIIVSPDNTVYHSDNNCLINTAEKMLVAGCKNSIIPSDGSVTSTGFRAFSGCTGLSSITIPYGVTSIGDSTFEGCTSLTNVTIPNSVTSIGGSAFVDCTALKSVTIPHGVTVIEITTFCDCTNLTSVTIPNTVTEIGDAAFQNCKSLCGIDIPDGVTSIGGNAFCGCSKLSDIDIPDNVTKIKYVSFYGCRFTNVIIPDGVTIIEEAAFKDCRYLSSIVIPDSVTQIEAMAFYGCSKLTDVYYSGTAEQWAKISIDNTMDPNFYLAKATIHYEYAG